MVVTHLKDLQVELDAHFLGAPQIQVFGLLNIWKPVSFDQIFHGRDDVM